MSNRRCAGLVLAAVCLSVTAGAAIPGDVNQDCKVDTADALKLSRAVMGAITLDSEQQDAADVAPIVSGASSPDSSITVADLVVLLRAVAGLQTLPGGVNVPKLNALPSTTTAGYVDVSGTACAGDVVKLYVKVGSTARLRGTVTAGSDGTLSFPLIGMAYGTSEFKATATVAGQTSSNSDEQNVINNQQIIDPDLPVLTGAITVWPPSTPYKINSDFGIQTGQTLILPPGTIVEFAGGSSFEVDGRLLVQGASGAAVTLRKSSSNRWDGIHIRAGQGTLIQSALILGANYPIKVTGANTAATLRGSELYEFLVGVDVSGGASVTVDGTWIHYGSNSGKGIVITNAGLTVTNSDLTNLEVGISVSGSSFATIGPGNEFYEFRDSAVEMKDSADGIITGNEIRSGVPGNWGIRLKSSSPEIRGNAIHGMQTGIRIAGSSNPLITDGNSIFANIWGIWIEGEGDVDTETTGNPNPIITGNTIRDNAGEVTIGQNTDYCSKYGANLCVSAFPPGINAIIDARNNYWGTNVPNTIRSKIINPDLSVFLALNVEYANTNHNFLEPVAIDLSNYRESENSGPGSTPLFYNTVTGVSHSPQLMAPTLGETLSIQFALVTPTDVTLSIFEEDAPANVKRTIQAPALGIGPHTIVWDGKDNAGNFVADEAYAYSITTTIAGVVDVFNPPRVPDGNKTIHLEEGTTPAPGPYNIYRNEPLKILFDVENARGRVRVNRVLEGSSPPVFETLADFAPYSLMNKHLFIYDGFHPDGSSLGSANRRYWFHPDPIQRNAVIVHRTAPLITGPSYVPPPPVPGDAVAPAIEVKGDPYLIRLSYDQLSRISFCIDQAAFLTVKILEPERGNPDIAADVVATLLQDTTTPHAAQNCNAGGIPHVVEWDGTAPGAGDPHVMQPVADGSYTFTIEARNALQPSLRSIYRGIVQTRL